MEYCLRNCISLFIFSIILKRIEGVSEEFCSDETFRASCQQNQMIQIESAQYGRMKLGKCVKSSLGFLGCGTDVRSRLDEKCSGKSTCEVLVTDSELVNTNPCSDEVKMYLQVDYSCHNVLANSQICTPDGVLTLKDSTNVISSRKLSTASCFSPGLQWHRKILASPGQQINVSLIDFQPSETSHACNEYGEVTDAHTSQGAQICSQGNRERTLLISNSNMLELVIKSVNPLPNFALRFEVLGCSDIKAPGNSWAERNGEEIRVGCRNSKESWTLKCQGNRWVGFLGNCSGQPGPQVLAAEAPETGPSHSLSSEVAIALIACVAILICVIVIAVGVNCWKKHSLKNYMLRIQQDALQQAMTQPQEESEYMMPIYRPKTDDGVDALYDFCYMPSSSVDPSRKTLRQNNLAPPPAKTLPVRNNDVKLNNSNTVRFKTTGPKLLETDPNV